MSEISADFNLSDRAQANSGGLTRTVANAYQWVDTTATFVTGATLSGNGYSLIAPGLRPSGNNGRIELNDGTVFLTSNPGNIPNNLTGTHFEITNSTLITTFDGAGTNGTQLFQAGNGRNTQIILRGTLIRHDGGGTAPGLNIAGALPTGNDIAGLTLNGVWYNDIVGIAHIGSNFAAAGTRPGAVSYIIRCGRPANSNQNNANLLELTKWYAGVIWPEGQGTSDGLNTFSTNVGITATNAQVEIWIIDPTFRPTLNNLPVNYFNNDGGVAPAPFVNLAYSHRPNLLTPAGLDINSDVLLKYDTSTYDIFNALPGVDGVLDANGNPVNSLDPSVRPAATATNQPINSLGYYVRHQRARSDAAGTANPSPATLFAENMTITNATDAYILNSTPYIAPGTGTTRHTFGFTNEGVDVTRGGAIINTNNIILIDDPYIQGATSAPTAAAVNGNEIYYRWKDRITTGSERVDYGAAFVQNGSIFETTVPINLNFAGGSTVTFTGNAVDTYIGQQGPNFGVSTVTAGTSITGFRTTQAMTVRAINHTGVLYEGNNLEIPAPVNTGDPIATFNGCTLNGTARTDIDGDATINAQGETPTIMNSPIVDATGQTLTVNGSTVNTNDLDATGLVLSNAVVTPVTTGSGDVNVTTLTATGASTNVTSNGLTSTTTNLTDGIFTLGSATTGATTINGSNITVTNGFTATSTDMTTGSISAESVNLGIASLDRATVTATSGNVIFGINSGITHFDATIAGTTINLSNNRTDGGTYTGDTVSTLGTTLTGITPADFPISRDRAEDFNSSFNGTLTFNSTGDIYVVVGPDFGGVSLTDNVTVNITGGGRLFIIGDEQPEVGDTAFTPANTVLGTNVFLEPVPVAAGAQPSTVTVRLSQLPEGAAYAIFQGTDATLLSGIIPTGGRSDIVYARANSTDTPIAAGDVDNEDLLTTRLTLAYNTASARTSFSKAIGMVNTDTTETLNVDLVPGELSALPDAPTGTNEAGLTMVISSSLGDVIAGKPTVTIMGARDIDFRSSPALAVAAGNTRNTLNYIISSFAQILADTTLDPANASNTGSFTYDSFVTIGNTIRFRANRFYIRDGGQPRIQLLNGAVVTADDNLFSTAGRTEAELRTLTATDTEIENDGDAQIQFLGIRDAPSIQEISAAINLQTSNLTTVINQANYGSAIL